MAVYTGSQGIASLREKIKLKSKMLVGESLEKIAVTLVDESPLGAPYYQSPTLGEAIKNDVGDFKNSWQVAFNKPNKAIREANAEGTGAVIGAITMSRAYNLEDVSFVTNNVEHAEDVEQGWDDNPEYGWKAKGGYHVVENNAGSAVAILEAVAQKVSKL
jgi:hypothetical protein